MIAEKLDVKVEIIANNIFKGLEGFLETRENGKVEVKVERTDGTEFIYHGKETDIEII